MLFIDFNTSLEISSTPIVAYKKIEAKNPESSFFQFFVITPLWFKIFGIALKYSFYQVFGDILWKFGVHYTVWWKIVIPQSQNFSFFPFTFSYFLYFWKTADVNIFSFLDYFFTFSNVYYISFSEIYSYIRFRITQRVTSMFYTAIYSISKKLQNPFCRERAIMGCISLISGNIVLLFE